MSEAYEAIDPRLECAVTVKILPRDMSSDPDHFGLAKLAAETRPVASESLAHSRWAD